MRVLLLTPVAPRDYGPPYGGAQIRVRELMKRLSSRHEITILALSSDSRPHERLAASSPTGNLTIQSFPRTETRVAALCRSFPTRTSLYSQLHRSRAFAAAVTHLLEAEEFDLIQCEFPYMAQYCAGLRIPWILVEHNIEFELSARLSQAGTGLRSWPYRVYARGETARRRREELEACRAATAVVVMSEIDRRVLLDVLPGLNVAVVPNGVDLDYYRPAGIDESPECSVSPSAVFVGRMDYRPNIDGARWFCREVLPLIRQRIPLFTLWIVGADPDPAVLSLGKIRGVQVTGEVADTRPYLTQASVVVAPLRAGSGTRLKILEAFAIARPVVSTSAGCEGIEATPGIHLLVADTAEHFASSVISLIDSPSQQRELALAARQLAEERYGWDSAAGLMEQVYADVLRRRPAR